MSQILAHVLTATVAVAAATAVSTTVLRDSSHTPMSAPLTQQEPLGKRFLKEGARLASRFNIDVRSHMRVKGSAAAGETRQAIVRYVWPSGRSNNSVTRAEDTSFSSIQTVKSAEKWTLNMRHGVVSHMFFLKSSGDSSCLFIYHEGHEPTPVTGVSYVMELATKLTGRGCDVLLLTMPLHGVNAQTAIIVNGVSMPIKDNALHNDFYKLESAEFSPFSYFVDPVISAIDEATRERSYDKIGLAGLSGGGWTTAFVGAIEPRLTHIYPVAGSMPFAMDTDPALVGGVNISSIRGDYEQSHQGFYRGVAGYFDLYLLGSMYPNRQAVHIYNLRDNCCFPGVASNAFSAQMTAIAKENGADLRFVIDTRSTRHEVSAATSTYIIESFVGEARPVL